MGRALYPGGGAAGITMSPSTVTTGLQAGAGAATICGDPPPTGMTWSPGWKPPLPELNMQFSEFIFPPVQSSARLFGAAETAITGSAASAMAAAQRRGQRVIIGRMIAPARPNVRQFACGLLPQSQRTVLTQKGAMVRNLLSRYVDDSSAILGARGNRNC